MEKQINKFSNFKKLNKNKFFFKNSKKNLKKIKYNQKINFQNFKFYNYKYQNFFLINLNSYYLNLLKKKKIVKNFYKLLNF